MNGQRLKPNFGGEFKNNKVAIILDNLYKSMAVLETLRFREVEIEMLNLELLGRQPKPHEISLL